MAYIVAAPYFLYNSFMQSLLATLKQIALRLYFGVRNAWPVWYGLLNYGHRTTWRRTAPPLFAWQERVLRDLQRDGIARTNLEEMFQGTETLKMLRAFAAEAKTSTGRPNRKKRFLFDYWPQGETLDLNNPFLSLALDDAPLQIANAYLELRTKLNYIHLADTLPESTDEAIDSQRWHRDPEEQRLCKMFVYLTDVDEGAGPFFYVRGSTRGGTYGKLFPQQRPYGAYPGDGRVESAVSASDIMTMTGPAGTVIFCDTSGLHKGGHATKRIRTMFTAFYTSPWWVERSHYRLPTDMTTHEYSPDAAYALSVEQHKETT